MLRGPLFIICLASSLLLVLSTGRLRGDETQLDRQTQLRRSGHPTAAAACETCFFKWRKSSCFFGMCCEVAEGQYCWSEHAVDEYQSCTVLDIVDRHSKYA
mmetsp:Transcript_129366/g.228762  ORF Transcript_129366/g.228762 Transcript_129366/m.228762 type:complete len:101 (+) Transcript_129366:82-384(+)